SSACATLNQASRERRPALQVPNPSLQKLLIEACLEALATGDIVALQDLGAAGLTGAAAEAAASGGCGVDIDTLLVPRREAGMTPDEVMLSESQERMLLVVEKGKEDHISQVFERWGLHVALIGHITSDGLMHIREGQTVVAEVP